MGNVESRSQFAYLMGKHSGASFRDVQELMRLGATHIRIETELTNGYKKANGNQDTERTHQAERKRNRIDFRLETIAKELGVRIEYGALTVRVVFADGREAGIP